MTFEELKRKVDEYKLNIAKYSGIMEQIKDGWRAKYGTDELNKIRDILSSKQEELKNIQEAIASATAEAEAIINDIESSRK